MHVNRKIELNRIQVGEIHNCLDKFKNMGEQAGIGAGHHLKVTFLAP